MRGTCQLGILPCNGMVYLPPHACTCEPQRKLNGFFALAQSTRRPYPDPSRYHPRLRRGPAAGTVARAKRANAEED